MLIVQPLGRKDTVGSDRTVNIVFNLQAVARRDASPNPTFIAGLQFCRRGLLTSSSDWDLGSRRAGDASRHPWDGRFHALDACGRPSDERFRALDACRRPSDDQFRRRERPSLHAMNDFMHSMHAAVHRMNDFMHSTHAGVHQMTNFVGVSVPASMQ